MVRIFGSPGRSRRLRIGSWLAACTAFVMLMAVPALAVHDLNFELDGNIALDAGGPAFDWVSFFNGSGQPDPVLPDASRPGFDASGFDRDFVTNANGSFNTGDNTTFATGSKDTLPITPGWQCNTDNNVLSKSDVMNAYAVSYVVPSGTDAGDEIMYFALERNANTGTGNVGFWFLQDGTVDCVSGGGATAFTGDHVDGDLLIVSEFSQGGTVATIFAYAWSDALGTIDPDPIAQGASCSTASGGDDICAMVNTGTLSSIPWLTANKQDGAGHSLRVSEFFEGGINLSDSGLGGKCFNTFIGDTRSSTSLTATIFDYSLGQLGACTSDVATTPVDNAGTPIPAGGLAIPGDPADASILVKDKADVTVTGGAAFSGTLSFHLCGPFAAASTTLCTTGGVAVSSQTITAGGTYTSSAATVTSAGRYCWRADFSGDSSVGVPGDSDSSATECFKVNPLTPALTTQAGAGPVDFGLPVTDTATLTNTAHKPGTGGPSGSTDGSINPATLGGDATGTITFTLYKNNTCTVLATGTGTNPQTVPVSGNGTYGPVSFTPDAPGTYHWVASYSGDLPNTTASAASACLDENEDVEVRQIPTEIKTRQSWYPNDTATISATSGNLAAGGTVVFDLYNNATCTGTAFYHQSFNVAGGAPTETFTTTNTNTPITTLFTAPADSLSGRYSWKVVYTPAAGDTAHTGKQSVCDAEHFNITYTNDPGPGSNLP